MRWSVDELLRSLPSRRWNLQASKTIGRVGQVIPLLVEYSEDDDTGCGLGMVAMIGVVVGGVILLRLVITQQRR
jgi:hypothetical protein